MKVLLKEDVENVGFAGEVFTVSPGYGRNYLIPRGLAELATPVAMKKATAWRDRAATRRAQIKAQYEALSAKISGVTLEFEAKAGSTGKLYGSITTAQLAETLAEKLGIEVDRRKIDSDSLRQVGEHQVAVRLDKDHSPEFLVIIKAEGADEEAAAAELEAEEDVAPAVAEA
jgi:large subunit ribosomal protein L9